MAAIIIGVWFLCGILGLALVVRFEGAERSDAPYVLLAISGPILLVLALRSVLTGELTDKEEGEA